MAERRPAPTQTFCVRAGGHSAGRPLAPISIGGRHSVELWTDVSLHGDALALVAGQAELVGPGVQPGDGLDSLAEADAVLVGSHFQGTAATFDRAPRLRVVARFGIGYDNIDVDAATTRGICVTHTPDAPTESTAEFAITLILALARRLRRDGFVSLTAGEAPGEAVTQPLTLSGDALTLNARTTAEGMLQVYWLDEAGQAIAGAPVTTFQGDALAAPLNLGPTWLERLSGAGVRLRLLLRHAHLFALTL